MTSWVARRVAHLEASSSVHSTSSPSHRSLLFSFGTESSDLHPRERLEVEPAIICSNEANEAKDNLVDDTTTADDDRTDDDHPHCSENFPSQSSAVGPHQQGTPGEGTHDDYAGGYYSRPKNPRHIAHEGVGSREAGELSAAANSLQQQKAQNARMARKITLLEAALVTSQARVAHLVASSASAAEKTSRRRRETEALIAKERACARQLCQLEDTLAQAEKRVSWLQGELGAAWACGIQRVNELDFELEVTRRKLEECGEGETTAENGSTDSSGGSSSPSRSTGGDASGRCAVVMEPGESLDKMMKDTVKALSDLRTKFYRAMGERNMLKARCDFLEMRLTNDGNVADNNAIDVVASGSQIENDNEISAKDVDTSDEGTISTKDDGIDRLLELGGDLYSAKRSGATSSNGNGKAETDWGEEGDPYHGTSNSSRGSSRSRSLSRSTNSIISFSASTSSIAMMGMDAAPVTTVGCKLPSWRWPPAVRQGSTPYALVMNESPSSKFGTP